MKNILFFNEICEFLQIPSIPKKKWDGKQHFDKGVGVIKHYDGTESYAFVKYPDGNSDVNVAKVFSEVQFYELKEIYIVPDYMNDISEVDKMDLDDTSKEHAKELLQQASFVDDLDSDFIADNEYYFDFIKNDEQAIAFIKAQNKKKRIRSRLPKTHEDIVMRLAVLFNEMKK